MGAVMIFKHSRNAATGDNSMYCMIPDPFPSLASHTLLAKIKAEGSGDRAYNVSFHSPCIGGEAYFMCTCYMWMSQVVVRVAEPAMERVPEIVMVAIVCQSLNPSQKQVHMRYVSPPIHGEWNETLYARSPDPSALFFARRVWLARLTLSLAQRLVKGRQRQTT